MYHLRHTQPGFTLIELLVALSISVILVLMTSSIFTYGIKHTRSIAAESRLVSAASHFVSVLAYEIRPATDVTVSGNTLTITQTDFSTSDLTFTSNTVTLDSEQIFDDKVIVNYVIFTTIDNTVQISYELTSDLGTAPEYAVSPLAATTTIAWRN